MKDEVHFIGKVAQKAILVHDGKVLLLKNAQDAQGAPWELPGGRLNEGEEPQEGLRRELREELGIEVEVGPVIHVERFLLTRTNEMHLLLVYVVTVAGEPAITAASDEVLEYRFVPLDALDTVPLYDAYRRAVQKRYKGQSTFPAAHTSAAG